VKRQSPGKKKTQQIEKLPDLNFIFISTLSKDSPLDALQLLTANIKDPVVLGAAAPAIKQWAIEDAPAAIAWADEHLVGKDRSAVISSAINEIARADLKQASAIAGTLPSGPVKNLTYQTLLNQQVRSSSDTNPKELQEWILSIDDATAQESAIDQSAHHLVRNHFATARFLAGQDNPGVARKKLILAVARHMRESDPTATDKWITTLPERNQNILTNDQ